VRVRVTLTGTVFPGHGATFLAYERLDGAPG
jgi:hypothetical protein